MAPKVDDIVKKGRMVKASQFHQAAHVVLEFAEDHSGMADAVATLAVHAGIAASDTLCIAALGEYHQGQDHRGAVNLLRKVDKVSAKHLEFLLGLKTRAGYGYTPISIEQLKRAVRAMDALVDSAGQRL